MRGSKINFNDRGFNVRLKANVKIEAGYGDATWTFVKEVKAHFYVSFVMIKFWLTLNEAWCKAERIELCAASNERVM